MRKNTFFLLFMLVTSHLVWAQQDRIFTLNKIQELARENYPMIRQYAMIEKAEHYSLENAHKAYLPQLNVGGQATYQSSVTQIPISLPGMNIPTISKDQYKLFGEVSQSITDLFTIKAQEDNIKKNAQIEAQKTAVEVYKLNDRINNLYFGILLFDAQITQANIIKKDLKVGIEQTQVAISEGIALRSAADNLKAELLKADQRIIELQASRKAYTQMLSLFIDIPIDENTRFEKPERQVMTNVINRPELKLFDLQEESFDVQTKLINIRNLPRLSAFFQGGLGRPGLNMLANDFQSYYIGGLRLSWNISGYYTYRNEKKMLANNKSMVDVQRKTFLFNTNLTLKQQNGEFVKAQELIEKDEKIVELRESVKNSTQIQLKFGTATTNDYLIAVNAEDQARQNMALHEIQMLMAEYNVQTTSGNY